ncbi:MAG: hypothetical protein K5744_10480 [Eubacterium sp.]|nr:hypothetical protein [Eubacterium sp.]
MERHAYSNSNEINKEAKKAKKHGLSYGEYKAGVSKDYAPKGYSVSPSTFVRRSDKKDDNGKISVFIK